MEKGSYWCDAGTFLQQSPPSKGILFINAGVTYPF